MGSRVLWWYCVTCDSFQEVHAVYDVVETWVVVVESSRYDTDRSYINPAYEVERDELGLDRYICGGCIQDIVDANGHNITDDQQLLALINHQFMD